MSVLKTGDPACLLLFQSPTEGYALPSKFTYPFCYEPHPLALLAADELQQYLEKQEDWSHNFGIQGEAGAIGKMFGVLVVQHPDGHLGYLAGFSGKLAGGNHHRYFVPPVFDILTDDGFYKKGERAIYGVTNTLEALEKSGRLEALKAELSQLEAAAKADTTALKQAQKAAKQARDARRATAQTELSAAEYAVLLETLAKESSYEHYRFREATVAWKTQISALEADIAAFSAEIAALKDLRRKMSADLQQQLFEHYTFLNYEGQNHSLNTIFQVAETGVLPPSGAGECAAPKLLQYAFLHQLKPVALAEFWWGRSPSSEIRKHGHFYPACKGKCGPILGHMLQGLPLDDNPLLVNPAVGKTFATVYEDDFLVVINKPAEFLSVPGKTIEDSVLSRLRDLYPEATGPLLVHRLDMSTSGLMLAAKTKDVHEHLQSQFIRRKVKKRYTALLEGIIEGEEGRIDLPLRVDLDDRPRQLVCYEHGKPAQTEWKVAERRGHQTLVHFFPITGRTHQLRVHAAHPSGLNTPIVGDDLYGKRGDRLHLHAASLTFMHPISREIVTIELEADF